MYDPRFRYYSSVSGKEKRGPYSPREKQNLKKIFLFLAGMIALGMVCGGLIIFLMRAF